MSTYSGGGGRQRAQRYVRVQDPAVGFFVAGSSNDGINGLYARTFTIPPTLVGSDRRFSLMYDHLDSGWHLGLAETGRDGDAYEWIFIDPSGRDRLANNENTLIPAGGDKWKIVHRSPPKGSSTSESGNGGHRPPGTHVQPAAGEDFDELPWQLIAILGEEMLGNLVSHKKYHDLLVHNALNCRPPPVQNGASAELAPPPEATAAAERPDADEARERGRHADAAALYLEELEALDLVSPETANTGIEAERTARAAWTRAVLRLRRVEALRRSRQLDAARNQVEAVLNTHPRYVDALFQSALTKLDGGDVQGAMLGMRALLCVDRAYPDIQEWIVRVRAREKRATAFEIARDREADRLAEEKRRAATITRGETPYCMAWRQTGGCDPEDGPREPEYDAPCTEPIGSGSSGWCECAAPWSLSDAVAAAGLYKYAREHPVSAVGDGGSPLPSFNVTHASKLTCAHDGGNTCDVECARAWRGELLRVEALHRELEEAAAQRRGEGAAEAAAAMKAAFDAMLAWEKQRTAGTRDDEEDARVGLPPVDGEGKPAASGSGSELMGAGDADPTAGWSDHYMVLSLPADFTDADLKSSYRRLSLRMHPDKPGGSMQAFQRVAESYQVLADPEQRRPYDMGVGLGEVDAEEGTETTVWDEIEQQFFPERHGFKPFGDPFERKRKVMEKRARKSGQHGGWGSRHDEF